MVEEETVSGEIDPLLPLKGQVAFITGSTSGIGRGIALRFAHDGADIIVHGRDTTRADEVRAEIEAMGRRAAVIIADLCVPADCERASQEAIQAFGRIDILVNNAGIGQNRSILRLEDESINALIDVNLRAVILLTKRILNKMTRNPKGAGGIRGRVINMSSIDGKTGHLEQSVYDATKFAIVGFTQSLALELGPRKIMVNAICPGHIDPPMWGPMGVSVRGLEGTPLRRYGTPADVAEVAAFLADPRNSYMTGQSLNVCGGIEFH